MANASAKAGSGSWTRCAPPTGSARTRSTPKSTTSWRSPSAPHRRHGADDHHDDRRSTDCAPTVERDLDGYYTRAQRLLPDGSAAWYFNDLCDRGYDEVDAGVRVAAMAVARLQGRHRSASRRADQTWRDAARIGSRPHATRGPGPHRTAVVSRHPRRCTRPPSRPARPTPRRRRRSSGDGDRPITDIPEAPVRDPEANPRRGRVPGRHIKSSWEAAVLERELAADDAGRLVPQPVIRSATPSRCRTSSARRPS